MDETRYDFAALVDAHDRLLSGRTVGRAVREPITSSWERCRLLGLAPDRAHATYHADLDFEGKFAHVAAPVLKRLESQLTGTPMTVLLSDERARILERRGGEPSWNRELDRLRLVPGFGLAEEAVGTNGIGTAFVAAGPTFVVGREHFADAWSTLACAGAPIHDPLSGQFLGVLDLTCGHLDADPTMLHVVTEAARDIEQRLLDSVTVRERALLQAYQEARDQVAGGGLPPADFLDPRDRLTLEEHATELIAAGRVGVVEVRLSGGRTAILVSRPIGALSGMAGVAVEAAFPGIGVQPLRSSQSSQVLETASSRAEPPVLPDKRPERPRATALSTALAEAADRWLLAVGEPVVGWLALRSRQRLNLIADASSRIGTTLEVSRTAAELTEVAVPQFADLAAVDLPDSVLLGEEPIRVDGPLRRVALRGALQTSHFYTVGDSITYTPSTPQAQALITGQPVREWNLSRAPGWMAHDPGRGSEILDAGVHSLIALPMLARGTALGVVSFYRSGNHGPFEEDDRILAEELVGHAAVCIDNARRFTREHATALTLQRSMLPSGLPAQHAVEAAHRYLAATSGAGGDWFDVIPLSGARVALVVGDVVGHGLHAAATMGRLRTAVHNFSALDLATDEILTQLDDLVIRLDLDDQQGGRPESGIVGSSCLYAVYDPNTRRCTLGRAGHPPPMIVLPDGSVEIPDMPAGPPLGLGGLPFETVDADLPEGSLLVLYTDGLVEELGGRDIEQGIARLRDALAGHPARTPEQACQVVDALLPSAPQDDIALLVARTRAFDAEHFAAWELPADPKAVSRVRADAMVRLAEWGLDELEFTTELIVSELVTNAIRYGSEPISLRLLRDSTLICEVSDGSSVAPRMRRARTTEEGGRGLFLVAQMGQRWGTRYTKSGKVIWVEQALPLRTREEEPAS